MLFKQVYASGKIPQLFMPRIHTAKVVGVIVGFAVVKPKGPKVPPG